MTRTEVASAQLFFSLHILPVLLACPVFCCALTVRICKIKNSFDLLLFSVLFCTWSSDLMIYHSFLYSVVSFLCTTKTNDVKLSAMARTCEIFAHSGERKFRFKTAIRGYHVHMNKWNPQMGEELTVIPEPENKKDKFACVVKNQNLKRIGHIPYEIAHICSEFLQEGKITGFVSGKRRRNTASSTGGLEIPCVVTCEGREMDKLKSDLKKNKRNPPLSWS